MHSLPHGLRGVVPERYCPTNERRPGFFLRSVTPSGGGVPAAPPPPVLKRNLTQTTLNRILSFPFFHPFPSDRHRPLDLT